MQAELHAPAQLVSVGDVLFNWSVSCCSSTQVSPFYCHAARVVCKAQVSKAPVAAAVASLTSLVAAHPASALVRTVMQLWSVQFSMAFSSFPEPTLFFRLMTAWVERAQARFWESAVLRAGLLSVCSHLFGQGTTHHSVSWAMTRQMTLACHCKIFIPFGLLRRHT